MEMGGELFLGIFFSVDYQIHICLYKIFEDDMVVVEAIFLG